MKKTIILTLLVCMSMMLKSHAQSSTQHLDVSSCYEMLNILESMKSGESEESISQKLDILLSSEPYEVMFKHYNRSWRPNHLPKEVFKNMLMSLQFPSLYKEGENRRADQMISKWKNYYADLDKYKQKLKLMDSFDLINMIPKSIQLAKQWLPDEMKVKAFKFYVLPHGGSGGFIINDATGYDLLQLVDDKEEFMDLIAHESHHKGLEIPDLESEDSKELLAYSFIQYFIGEGTALRFINNAPGGFAPKIFDRESTGFYYPGLTELWGEYTSEQTEIINHFVNTTEQILKGEINEDDLNNEIRSYWGTGIMGRLYFLGGEFFGAIYHGLGKEACFEAMRDPRKLPDLYNKAVKKNPKQLAKCPLLPEHFVQKILSIGQNEKKL